MYHTDEELIAAFENCSVDPEQFDHAEHVHVAWIYLNQFDLTKAISKYTAGLKNLTAHLGVPGKYHETITWFYIILISERRTRDHSKNWNEFCESNQDLLCYRPPVFTHYYPKEIIDSALARQQFILPIIDQPSRSGNPPSTSK